MTEKEKVVSCDCNTMISITKKTRRNWSDLQLELIELILKRLALVDIARFKLVSSSWNAAAKSYISGPVYKPLVPQTPWLMLPRELSDVDTGRFFSLSEKKVYTFRNLFQGFREHEKCLVGSSYGWLVMSDLNEYRVHLFNPISRVRIILPPLGFQATPRVLRVFLSSDPSCNKTFYVVVLYVNKVETKIAFHKHGDDGNNATWTNLDSVDGGFDRIIFHNSLLFALSLGDSKSISVWDFGGTYPIKTIDFQPPEREVEQRSYRRHLVESLGELLFVEKLENLQVSGQFYYDVHKLNFSPNKVECLKVKCLQERALVLSEDEPTSMSLSTVDFPELEANSIYVAQQHYSFIGVSFSLYAKVDAYNLESKVFNTYYTSQVDRHKHLLWIVPNPCLV